MNVFTKKQRNAYLKEVQRIGRKCPFCGSYEVTAEVAELGSRWIRVDVECDKCLEDWTDIYKLVDIEKDQWEEELRDYNV